jgi:hypothetical protein
LFDLSRVLRQQVARDSSVLIDREEDREGKYSKIQSYVNHSEAKPDFNTKIRMAN